MIGLRGLKRLEHTERYAPEPTPHTRCKQGLRSGSASTMGFLMAPDTGAIIVCDPAMNTYADLSG
jgi:hypothetical protein